MNNNLQFRRSTVCLSAVVIQKERRGQGLGRKLIELAEDHARNQGYDAIYLFTTDKEKFYERLGYDYCKPVNTLGAQVKSTFHMIQSICLQYVTSLYSL